MGRRGLPPLFALAKNSLQLAPKIRRCLCLKSFSGRIFILQSASLCQDWTASGVCQEIQPKKRAKNHSALSLFIFISYFISWYYPLLQITVSFINQSFPPSSSLAINFLSHLEQSDFLNKNIISNLAPSFCCFPLEKLTPKSLIVNASLILLELMRFSLIR